MKIYRITDSEFKIYGKTIGGYDVAPFLSALKSTQLPDGTEYVTEEAALQSLPEAMTLGNALFGGLPAQFGWCNGHNTKLNCLEFHRNSEFLLGTEDFILLIAKQDEIVNGTLDTDKVKALLQTYRITDPVTNDTVGVFLNADLAALYAQLVARGQTSSLEALHVGALNEEVDIVDLQKSMSETTRPDILSTYDNLMRASRNHLRAFVGQIQSQGIAYVAQTMPQAEVDAIINSPNERGQGGGGQGGGRGNGQGRGR